LLQAASAAAATRVAKASDFFISRFPFMGRKTISGNCQCGLDARVTEQQGLELLLLSPKLYAEKNQGFKP